MAIKRKSAITKLQEIMQYADVTCLSGQTALDAAYFEGQTEEITAKDLELMNKGYVFVIVAFKSEYCVYSDVLTMRQWCPTLAWHINNFYEHYMEEIEIIKRTIQVNNKKSQ